MVTKIIILEVLAYVDDLLTQYCANVQESGGKTNFRP